MQLMAQLFHISQNILGISNLGGEDNWIYCSQLHCVPGSTKIKTINPQTLGNGSVIAKILKELMFSDV